VNKTVTNHRVSGTSRSKGGAGAGFAVSSFFLVWLLASVLVHPLPHEASHRAGAPLLLGADIPRSVADIFGHACGNCHSENTRWPWYSHVAPVSWFVEKDVQRARQRLNLSRWDSLDAAQQRLLLTAIATVIENREMPLHRYVVFHREVKLSTEESVQVIEWTHAERRRLRASVPGSTAK
jgi:Haem-binding domain